MKFKKLLKSSIGFMLVAALASGSISASAYTAGVYQGDTEDAGDCIKFYQKFYGNNSYTTSKVGFNTSSNTPTGVATQNDFINARNKTAMYWSSHGSTSGGKITLNYFDNNKRFNSLETAQAYWNTDTLKVAIFGACYQLDAPWRSGWVNVMRNSDIRVIAGYHETAPTTGNDTSVANITCNYLDSGSTGNSVRYCWQLANESVGWNANWLVLSYAGEGREYYRMPGFSSTTYPAPTSSTSIYRFSNAYPNGTAQASLENPSNDVVLSVNLNDEVHRIDYPMLADAESTSNILNDDEMQIINFRENVCEDLSQLPSMTANGVSNVLSTEDLGLHIDEQNTKITENNLVMAEVFGDGTEGEEIVIGNTIKYQNLLNGIPVYDNFVKICSDAEGTYAVINKWKDLSASPATISSGVNTLSVNDAYELIGAEEACGEYELIYYPVSDGEYHLSYMIKYNGICYVVDCLNNNVVTL